MHGVGPPLVTPFTRTGDLDESSLRDLVAWVESRGVDFLVPCGSNSEAELMTAEERRRTVEIVADAADVPVLAGTGHPGFAETRAATADAAAAGADAALVVTPFYYNHDEDTLVAYYEDLADVADVPIYLYSVPVFTGTRLSPDAVARLAEHPNVAGMKDSSGDLEAAIRIRRRTVDADFELFVGSGSILGYAMMAGADGGVLALANIAPGASSRVVERFGSGDHEGARDLNDGLVELNHAITAGYGISGLKAAMRHRGAPAGYARRPHRPPSAEAVAHLTDLVDAAPLVETP
jgi:dihydrodipicolinate synthase/N-acetylneuraminate lyase